MKGFHRKEFELENKKIDLDWKIQQIKKHIRKIKEYVEIDQEIIIDLQE
jgi:hypothetical protein